MADSNAYDHVYLSPHLDDAVLSCGGRIWQQAQAGKRVLVVTIFAGSPMPDAPLSPFAQGVHADWNLPGDAAAQRRREDLAALDSLGVDGLHWPYLDCIYRQTPDGCFPYASEASLFGEIHPAEEALVAELVGRFTALPLAREGTLYAPLGIGHHVDHRIVHRGAARAATAAAPAAPIHEVLCYEDYPYAEKEGATQRALADGLWRMESESLPAEAVQAKIDAIACYRSQLRSLNWPDAASLASAVWKFATEVGDGNPAERCWK